MGFFDHLRHPLDTASEAYHDVQHGIQEIIDTGTGAAASVEHGVEHGVQHALDVGSSVEHGVEHGIQSAIDAVDNSIVGQLGHSAEDSVVNEYHAVQHDLQQTADHISEKGLGTVLSEGAGELKHEVQQHFTDDVVDPLEHAASTVKHEVQQHFTDDVVDKIESALDHGSEAVIDKLHDGEQQLIEP